MVKLQFPPSEKEDRTPVVVSEQPEKVNPFQVVKNEWTQHLCNCCGDCSICCFSTWCGPCQTYSTAMGLGQSGILCCLGWWILPCLPTLMLRQQARERFDIQGSTCGDCCSSCLCTPCVMCQTAREVGERK